ncbi:hypothetical protein F0223_20070 [Vibrio coralliilyticus]|uniref:RidA family protein n=1 Tax=Vibrio TaxID=662 RepID=UPI0005017ECE|nr:MULTISPECIES: Rid family hydrolase [Vibrio]KFI13414.1 hypothetical protein IX95_05570 [Vibrio sp. B183]NOI20524.1 hypothetical protein [Vibrio coralliilyticus]
MKFIQTDTAPTPNGHYNQASVVGQSLYISAQLPHENLLGPSSQLEEAIPAQTHSVLESLLAITHSAGGDVTNLAFVRFYTTDLRYWPLIDKAFATFMGNHKPARSVIIVSAIKQNFLVMAEATSELPKE